MTCFFFLFSFFSFIFRVGLVFTVLSIILFMSYIFKTELLKNICNQLTKCMVSCSPYLIFINFLSRPGTQRRLSLTIYYVHCLNENTTKILCFST